MFKAMPRQLIVKRLDVEQQTESKVLFLPETQRYLNPKCRVLAVGKNVDPVVKVGDLVHVRAYDGVELDKTNHPGVLMVDEVQVNFIYEE